MKASSPRTAENLTNVFNPTDANEPAMSELGKMEEGRDHDTGLCLRSCKAETGLGRTDYRRDFGNSHLQRSESQSLKQEATKL
jgi:hypothetical protein